MYKVTKYDFIYIHTLYPIRMYYQIIVYYYTGRYISITFENKFKNMYLFVNTINFF